MDRSYLKPHNLPTFTSFMFLNERRKKKKMKVANVIKNREALFSLWPSALSLFDSLLYVSVHAWREGW